MQLVHRLWDEGRLASWWDQWCVPRHAATGRFLTPDKELENVIQTAMRASSYFVQVNTKNYLQSLFTSLEEELARDLEDKGNLRIIRVPREGVLPDHVRWGFLSKDLDSLLHNVVENAAAFLASN